MSDILKLLALSAGILMCGNAYSQGFNLGLQAGANYGGPIGMVDSAEGKPLAAYEFGVFSSIKLAEKWSFKPHLYYTLKGAGYWQKYTRDTIVEIEIQGVKGEIPTFYSAEVKGNIKAHYLEMPLMISYQTKRNFFVETGPYISYLLTSRDKGHLHLDIGEDGFLSDDRDFDYTEAIHQMEYGLGLSGGYQFPFGMSLYIKGTRSLRRLYKTSHFESQGQAEVKLYNTIVSFGLKYVLFGGKQEKV